ncbi:hypothetical protein POM88_034642 [Heracleum sosnowskyi]|uniref:Major facilitator superfamily (MFS) profile domain-containing protein n=1 Tax=Heracleum sosnowskyi TaxID=360622 RepID=A0AAD8MAQ8_9APIA|nr:hypothetical protein POM88_034642 [Heracleum sosnowskyi]
MGADDPWEPMILISYILVQIGGQERSLWLQLWGFHSQVLKALAETMKRGTSFGTPCLLENVLAEMVISTIPSLVQDSDASSICLQYSFFGSILTFGAMIGAITSGRIADFIGRKGALRVASGFCVAGWLEIYFAQGTVPLDIGRLATGYGMGVFSYVVPVFIAEIAPKNLRGALIVANQGDQNAWITDLKTESILQKMQLIRLRAKYAHAILASPLNEKRKQIINEAKVLYNKMTSEKVMSIVLAASEGKKVAIRGKNEIKGKVFFGEDDTPKDDN